MKLLVPLIIPASQLIRFAVDLLDRFMTITLQRRLLNSTITPLLCRSKIPIAMLGNQRFAGCQSHHAR